MNCDCVELLLLLGCKRSRLFLNMAVNKSFIDWDIMSNGWICGAIISFKSWCSYRLAGNPFVVFFRRIFLINGFSYSLKTSYAILQNQTTSIEYVCHNLATEIYARKCMNTVCILSSVALC